MIWDIRKGGDHTHQVKSHDGPKAQKNIWTSNELILTSGFNRNAEREYAVWDLRNFSEPVCRKGLGSGQSVVIWHYNPYHNILYTSGKGSMDIGIYKFSTELPEFIKHYSNSTSPQPTIGFSLMPR